MLYLAAAGAAGYVVSVYTWPTIRGRWLGAEAEVDSLRARIQALKTKLSGN